MSPSPLPHLSPSKIVCVGRNYLEHARELGNDLPTEPLIFLKPPSAIIAEGQPIPLPAVSRQVEFEGEIGVVIGTRLRDASIDEARRGIQAIVAANDVTARDLQKTDGQWTRGKGFDGFLPLGEPAAPPESLEQLTVVTTVNGRERQRASAAEMAFDIPRILAYVSGIMTLEPGDLVLTGTPAGVGTLAPDDVVEIQVLGPGDSLVSRVRNPVTARR